MAVLVKYMTDRKASHTNNSSVSKAQWSSLGTAFYVKTTVLAVLVWFFLREEFARLVSIWSNDSSWSHGFLIPVFSLYLLNQKKEQILTETFKPSYVGLVCLLLCIILYPLNLTYIQIGTLNYFLIIMIIGSIVLFLGGWKLIKYSWFPIAYLVFAIPWPNRFYRSLTIPLRKFAAEIASVALNLVPGMEADSSGSIIDIAYRGVKLEPGLDVADACSGMRLLVAFVALGVAMAYLHYRPLWQRMVLLLSTVPIAILCNIIRVTVTAFIYIFIGPEYAQGTYHDMLGLMMLPLAFVFYWLIGWFMENLFVEQEKTEPDVIVRKKQQ